MTQRHYDIYVETVWNCASSKACSSVYLLEKDNAAFIQKNGKPIAVVISYERYERLLKSGIDINEF